MIMCKAPSPKEAGLPYRPVSPDYFKAQIWDFFHLMCFGSSLWGGIIFMGFFSFFGAVVQGSRKE